VRRTRETPVLEAIDICILLANLQKEYGWEDATRSERLVITGCSHGKIVRSDPVLVKMLLHNLINNALSHAQGKVSVSLADHQIVILDEGGESSMAEAGKAVPESFHKSMGMGMYIVNLICDALQWQHEITINEKAGITVTIHFGIGCSD
jgi:K+-sensing histidine kinase KdpD